jgi:hypothetical protein
MHEGTTDFLKLTLIVGSIAGFLWWLHTSFGPYYALGAVIIAVILLFGTLMFVAGSFNAHKIQKSTMEGISKFNAQDATIDRYRMQSLRVLAQGESAKQKADSQLKVIEAKKELRQLPTKKTTEDATETFWSNNETVDLEEWS